jgi:hypothetical protein
MHPRLSRVRTSTAASGGRPDMSDDPMDVRLGGRLPADGEAVGRPPGPSSKAVRRRRTAAPSARGRPQLPSTSAVHLGPSACAVRSL